MVRPHVDETIKRREIIKKWILEDGITNRSEIKRRLKAEYGIDVSRQSIYKDFAAIAKFSSEDLKEFELDIMGLFKKYIREMEVLIEKETDSYKKAQLIKMLSQVIKDRHSVAASISIHGKPKESDKQRKKDDEINISFG